ncbi:MAG: anti-sigma factor [Acidobacteriota bacterium]
MSHQAQDRLFELMATQATEGLGLAESSELARLLEDHSEIRPEEFELAAAAIDEAMAGPIQEMPAQLAAKVRNDSQSFFAERPRPAVEDPPATRVSWGPWLVAAAGLLLAILGWWPRTAPVVPSPTTAEIRSNLLRDSPDAQQIAWTATEDLAARGAEGDVVWSSALQQGFMRIRGLEVNDPGQVQYQLWIFDKTRDERYPVDGGVFDIPAGASEVVIPIASKLQVNEPFLFAITVEPPGGVVVSSRERIVLTAAV